MKPGNDLFAKEEAVLASAEGLIEETVYPDPQTKLSFEALVVEYRKLLKTQRRLIRLSDRNERELNAMAEKQKVAAEEISKKNLELEAISGKLAKYLSPQVYNSIFSGKQEVKLNSQRKKLTVFFSDIAGFSNMTDKMESEDLTRLLNQYLTEMSQIALEYGATIDKYIGDAIMIFFGDPESRGVREDAIACVKMAFAMQNRISQLQDQWRSQGISDPLNCRIGVNTGYCTVGNFGSDDRMDYTIIGGAVNVASRLETEANTGDILISYETYAHVKDEIACDEIGPIQVKGIAHPVVAYRVKHLVSQATEQEKHLNVDLPNVNIRISADRMSPAEREKIADVLRKSADVLDGGYLRSAENSDQGN